MDIILVWEQGMRWEFYLWTGGGPQNLIETKHASHKKQNTRGSFWKLRFLYSIMLNDVIKCHKVD